MALDCLSALVGLSNRDCPCLSAGQLSGYNDSDSGYYLTDDEHGFPMLDAAFANTDCSEGSVWDMLTNARLDAIRDFKSDFQQALNADRESLVVNYRGLIAKAENSGLYPVTTNVMGLQVRPKRRMKDAFLVIKALWLGIDTTGDTVVTVSSSDPDFATVTYTVPVNGARWTRYELPAPLYLPLYSIGITDLKYNFSYTTAGRAKVNKLWCCSKPAWMTHLDVAGFSIASLNDTDTMTGTTGQGLSLEVYFDCAKLDWICDLHEMNGLEFRDLLARCIQFKGAIKLMSRVIESGRINYYTLLQNEAMTARRTKFQQLYSDYIKWAVQNMPPNVSSCWGCMKNGPRLTSLM